MALIYYLKSPPTDPIPTLFQSTELIWISLGEQVWVYGHPETSILCTGVIQFNVLITLPITSS